DLSKVELFKSLPDVKPYENLLSFIKVNNSEANLAIKYKQLEGIVNETKPFRVQFYLDVRRNNIVLETFITDRRRNENFLQEIEPLKLIVIFLRKPGQSQNLIKRQQIVPKILLGENIYDQNTNKECTIGFFAKNKTNPNLTYIVTAGHFTDPGNQISYDEKVIGSTDFAELYPFDFGIFIRTLFLVEDMLTQPGDSGAPIFFYSSDLRTVSLAGILIGSHNYTGRYKLYGVSVSEILKRGNIDLITFTDN
ncbi:18486_t:CDS:2, partial [Racocetra persica]